MTLLPTDFPTFKWDFSRIWPHVNFNRVSLHIIKRGNRIKECLREDYGLAEEIKNRTLILDLSLGLTIFFHPFLSQSIILAFHFFSLSLSLSSLSTRATFPRSISPVISLIADPCTIFLDRNPAFFLLHQCYQPRYWILLRLYNFDFTPFAAVK